jgi:hypothetical protein
LKNTKSFLSKLEDRSTPMVLLGYEEGNKAYPLFNPKGGKVVISRDVVFNKDGGLGLGGSRHRRSLRR